MKLKLLIMVLLILPLQTGCLYAVRYDGIYRGKIVDQETREPIEGVVVLGTWSVYHFSPAGGYHTYYDARETVTDKKGEFVIPGEGLRILSSVEPMSFTVFKAGYRYREYHWDTLKSDIPKKEEEQTKWKGDMPVFPIKKLTIDERKKMPSPPDPPDEASFENVKWMLREIDKDRVERGLDVRGFWGGKKYE